LICSVVNYLIDCLMELLIQWKPLNVITVNVISHLLRSHFIGHFCYAFLNKTTSHLFIVISFPLSQSDHIKRLDNILALGVSICLDVMDNLDTLKKLVSTQRTLSTVQKPSLDSLDYSKKSRFLDFCLDLDSLKKSILT